ncbi:MFS transporter [Kineococcus rhizosphaerae]|uniref:Putative MFS family arabinose efflux permease n=1 Tax=Kineococcus rhizosphaerae TaxID=559628 RepID=A0A2T0QXI1_9ACTN|nr:MFS transporter [Kineococcus rhizosphaerae]PRY10756.1 putative MFS family arabinose efflux permease [Kineococcus rhizosphaerae]
MSLDARPGAGPDTPWLGHERGTPGYRRLVVALFAAGLATFAQLYSVQAVLPAMASGLHVGASASALGVSAATGALAVSVVGWSALADRLGRVPVMVTSVVLATLLGLVVPLATSLAPLLALRALQGAALGGLPAIAMAYLAEEVHAREVALAAGAYISGNSLGGLTGRIVSSAVADVAGWRWGVAAPAVVGLVATVVFCALVPRSRGFVRHRSTTGPTAGEGLRSRVRQALADPGLLALYAQALLLMGAFVTVYNYLGFRLVEPPFSLSQAVVGLLFVVYLAGTLSSSVAGRLAARGRLRVLLGALAVFATGCLLTLAQSIVVVVAGLVLLTAGFFAAHSVASGWVGARARPRVRAQASALYTFAYYAGSSVVGWLAGFAFGAGGWTVVVGVVVALAVCAAVLALLGLRGRTEAGSMGA